MAQYYINYDCNAHYFSINDILSSQSKVPCKFEVKCMDLGFLDATVKSQHLNPGAKVDLPFWLASALSTKKKIVTVDVPKAYADCNREILNADATIVDLNKLGPYFYTFGLHLQSLQLPQMQEIADILQQVFRDRFKKILDYSLNATYEDCKDFMQTIDETEKQLVLLGQKAVHDQSNWIYKRNTIITSAHLIECQRKRKWEQATLLNLDFK